MPPRRRNAQAAEHVPAARAGARPGILAADLRDALRAEERRLAELPEHLDQAQAVSDFFAALDTETERIALIRIRAVVALSRGGMSHRAIAEVAGISKTRVGQLLADPRFN